MGGYLNFGRFGGGLVPPDASLYEASYAGDSINTVTSINVVPPSGIEAGELQLLFVMNRSQFSDMVIDTPSGWTKVGDEGSNDSDSHIAAFWKVGVGDETTINVGNSTANRSTTWAAWWIRLPGADTSTPVNQSAFSRDGQDGGTKIANIPGITTTADGCLVFFGLAWMGSDGTNFATSSTGWSITDQQEGPTSNNNECGACWGTKEMPSAGATGTAAVTYTGASFDGNARFQLAINPA